MTPPEYMGVVAASIAGTPKSTDNETTEREKESPKQLHVNDHQESLEKW